MHRVLEPAPGSGPAVLPQQAWRLDPDPAPWRDEVIVDVHRLNLDAASYRQLREQHHGDGGAVRAAVLAIAAQRGKVHNPVTGSGGMLIGTVRAVGAESSLGLAVGDRIATLVSLTLTPLRITDGLAGWDGLGEQVPCRGTAVLFGRSVAAVLPADLPEQVALSVLDVCGAPALTDRVVREETARLGRPPSICVLGGGGKSGTLALAAAREAGATGLLAVVPAEAEARRTTEAGVAGAVALADARDALAVRDAVHAALGGPADVTVVCVDVAGCESGAVLCTADGGTVVFFAMATSFAAAALGAEGLAADVRLLIGNGYLPGHARLALDLVRRVPGVRTVFDTHAGTLLTHDQHGG
jgi:L-erythro-3,5-diaminohexanoate dehydrogenase